MTELRPAAFCREILTALEATEGRRRRRKRNTSADAIGLTIKRRQAALLSLRSSFRLLHRRHPGGAPHPGKMPQLREAW